MPQSKFITGILHLLYQTNKKIEIFYAKINFGGAKLSLKTFNKFRLDGRGTDRQRERPIVNINRKAFGKKFHLLSKKHKSY